MEETLVVRNLAVVYGNAQALSAVELTASAHGRVGVVGRNGAGKSTLLRAIAGGVRVAAGTIEWCGEDITRLTTAARVARGIAIVLEGGRTFRGLSVDENLRLGALSRRRPSRAQRDFVLDLFPVLSSRLRVPAGALSGGENQMLAIGQALMGEPRMLLLDEPSIGLAPTAVSALLGTLRELSDSGLAIVLVEQSLRLAVEFAEELTILRNGKSECLGEVGKGFDMETVRSAYLS